MNRIRTEQYRRLAGAAMTDPVLKKALAVLQARLGQGALDGYRELPEGPDLRRLGHAMRMHAISHLDLLHRHLARQVRANGGEIHYAADAKEAIRICLDIAKAHQVRRIVKGKSMVTEEIGLNPALEKAGLEVCETDLGEYIVQLAGESPSHIMAPAAHHNRQQIGRLFQEKLGMAYSDDPATLTLAARKALRKKFLAADMGITGCNLACAETGHIGLVSNEGNIRMATTLPKVHVAIMGMERITARMSDYAVLFRLLSRGTAGQPMAAYASFIGGPRLPDQNDGPQALHLIVLDNGRKKILADPEFREVLCCVRCGGCLNACPVYRHIGGHAYGFVYPGPIGAVLSPLLVGLERAKHLFQGETLCGACRDICPVNIDLPRMLLALRRRLKTKGRGIHRFRGAGEEAAYNAWAWTMSSAGRYRVTQHGLAIGGKWAQNGQGMIRRLPGKAGGWTSSRDLRAPAAQSFRRRQVKGK